MGSSRTPAEFVAKIHKVGQATDRHRREAVNAGAFEAKKVMLASASAKGVQPGGKIAGKRWTVRYDVKGIEQPAALVRFTGPFHLVNNPTRPHYIVAKGLGGSRGSRGERAFQASAARFSGGSARGTFAGQRRSRGARAIKVGENRLYAYVFHPGTPGKDIFRPAKLIASRQVPKVMADSMKGAWRRVLT